MKVSGHSHDSAALSPGLEPRYLSNRRFGRPQGCSERFGEEEKSFLFPEFEPWII
jgi:hypothetical protein